MPGIQKVNAKFRCPKELQDDVNSKYHKYPIMKFKRKICINLMFVSIKYDKDIE